MAHTARCEAAKLLRTPCAVAMYTSRRRKSQPPEIAEPPAEEEPPPPVDLEISAFVRWLANIKESTRTYEMSIDMDVEWKASPADLACSESDTLSSSWMPSLVPMLVVQAR